MLVEEGVGEYALAKLIEDPMNIMRIPRTNSRNTTLVLPS
jgi:hypothetical protein